MPLTWKNITAEQRSFAIHKFVNPLSHTEVFSKEIPCLNRIAILKKK